MILSVSFSLIRKQYGYQTMRFYLLKHQKNKFIVSNFSYHSLVQGVRQKYKSHSLRYY